MCLLIGLFVVPFRHIFQLDAVLTQEEMANQQIRDRTREILETVSQGGNEWLIWVIAGVVLLVLSVIGLSAVGRQPEFSENRV